MYFEENFDLTLSLPFRLDLTVWTLRRRAKNRIDKWENETYSRIFVTDNKIISCQVVQIENSLKVKLNCIKPINNSRLIIEKYLRQMLGLERNIKEFYLLSRNNNHLEFLAKSFVGMKPPRFPTIFEALVNAISCQQVTLDLGILLLNRISEKFGLKFEYEGEFQYAFPRPVDFKNVSEEEIKKLGYSYQKSRAIKELALVYNTYEKQFSDLENKSNEEIVEFLSSLRGIGRWSSEYVLLRGLGRLDVFPGDDVGAQKNLQQLLNLSKRPDYDEIKILTEKWQPYAGLVYFHLLLEKLQDKNLL